MSSCCRDFLIAGAASFEFLVEDGIGRFEFAFLDPMLNQSIGSPENG